MRLNVNGYLTLRLAFNTTVHAPEKSPTDVLVHRVQEKLGHDVGELLEATGFGDDDPMPSEKACIELLDMAREGMSHMEIRVEGREPGDPAECDCSVCCRPCRHEPDYSTVRSCSSKDLGCEVQCALCKQWGAFCVDEKSVGWADDGAWHLPTESKLVAAGRAEEPSRAAMERALRACGINTSAHVYGASEFVAGRATKPTWTANTVKDLAREVYQGISDKAQADNVALYVDGQWMGDLPMAQWQADLCFAYGAALSQWAALTKAEEAAFDEAVATGQTWEPESETDSSLVTNQRVCPECLAMGTLAGHKTCGRPECVRSWRMKRDARVAADLAAHESSSK